MVQRIMQGATVHIVDITFEKKGMMVYISHLDLVRLFTRVFRKVNLPLVYSQGFNPRPKISFKRALRLGVKGKKEELFLRFYTRIDLKNCMHEINKQLPRGIRLLSMIYRKAVK